MTARLGWAAAVTLCACLAVWGHADPRRRWVHWFCKPLTTTIILVMLLSDAESTPTTRWFAVGLVLSTAGDAALIAPRLFIAGLASFLLALACYATAFSLGSVWSPWQLAYLLLPAVITLSLCQSLWSRLGPLRVPVALYVAMVTVMAWRAFCRFDAVSVSLSGWLWVSAGALLFMAGDALLARRRFLKAPIPYAVELGVYYAAQFCLVTGLVSP